jgi:hypothetical protein
VTKVSLKSWLENGWLVEHRATAGEIAEVLSVADRDLHDCQAAGLSPDWKLNIAYSAVLQAATAALAAAGYRAVREAHHYRTLQSLAHTVGAAPHLLRRLDAFRKKRNVGSYQRSGSVSEQEAQEMVALARQLREEVTHWLWATHPELMTD